MHRAPFAATWVACCLTFVDVLGCSATQEPGEADAADDAQDAEAGPAEADAAAEPADSAAAMDAGATEEQPDASEPADSAVDAATPDASAASDPCARPKPGPDSTGVRPGITLAPSGSVTVKQAGKVVENLDIRGTITVLANDVTIRNVRITTGDYYPIRYFDNDNTGLVVEDSEIIGTSGNVTSAVAFANYTARRLNIHGMADGLKADSNVLIEDCWIHDLSNGEQEHNDGVQSTGGKGVTIRHNDISGASNACVQAGDEGGATEDLTIECNWLSGGGYTLNIRGKGATRPRNTRVINNRFGRDSGYGPWTFDDPSPTVRGNVY
ncbi:MAG TPA: right-handed parallel beta-helix repeat-containing protein, partial [Polyangiales bacterium]